MIQYGIGIFEAMNFLLISITKITRNGFSGGFFIHCPAMNFLKNVIKPSTVAAAVKVTTQKIANPINIPLRPEHWKRWYFIGDETRHVLLSRTRWFFFLIYPAWVLTHLEDYKPNPDRVRRAYYETQLGSPISPLHKLEKTRKLIEDGKQPAQF